MTTTTTVTKLKYLVTSMPEALQSLEIRKFTLLSCYASRRLKRTPLKDTTAGTYRILNQQTSQPWLWWAKLLTQLQQTLSLSFSLLRGLKLISSNTTLHCRLNIRQEDGELLALHTLEHHITLNKGYHAETYLWRSQLLWTRILSRFEITAARAS